MHVMSAASLGLSNMVDAQQITIQVLARLSFTLNEHPRDKSAASLLRYVLPVGTESLGVHQISMSAGVVASSVEAGADIRQQPSAESLWGDLGGLNLEAYGEWEDDVHYIDVDALVAELVQCSPSDHPSLQPLLQQLSSHDTPPYAVIGSEQWPQLASMLPSLLTSGQQDTAALSLQLLQQQLAPELLHCSPEPLAQLLTALLQAQTGIRQGLQLQSHLCMRQQGTDSATRMTQVADAAQAAADLDAAMQHTAGQAGDSTNQLTTAADQLDKRAAGSAAADHGSVAAAAAAAGAAAGGCRDREPYPAAVLQFLTSGLQKLGRQWHFLADALAADLCGALVTALLEPLVHYSPHCNTPAAVQQGFDTGTSASAHGQGIPQQLSVQQIQHSNQSRHTALPQPQQQQQQQQLHGLKFHQLGEQQCQEQQQQHRVLVVQLLHHDPMLSWWHRLHANSASSRCLKAAAQQQGLPMLLMHWVTHWLQQQRQQHGGNATTTTSSLTQASEDCVAAHCLAVFLGTPSGRQILQALHQQQLCVPQQQQQQHQSQHPQDTQQANPCTIRLTVSEPLALALKCMRGWASLQCSSSSSTHPLELQPAQQVQEPQGFTPWGPVKPAGLAAVTAAPCSHSSTQVALQSEAADQDSAAAEAATVPPADRAEGLSEEAAAAVPAAAVVPAAGCDEDQFLEVPGSGAAGAGVVADAGVLLCGVVTQAAAATAAWGLQAYEEQLPWFEV